MNRRVTMARAADPVAPRAVHPGGEAGGEALAFASSMPERYRQLFDESDQREHARIVAARGRSAVHADVFGIGRMLEPGLCVVAPDAPGLLASVSAALIREDFDIRRAEAFTRRAAGGGHEAVDFFWIRRDDRSSCAPLCYGDAAALRATLLDTLSNPRSAPALRVSGGGRTHGADISARFVEHASTPWLTLELECDDRRGLLLSVTTALFREGVQIVGSRIRTVGTRVHDRFDLLNVDGSRVEGDRLQRIQLAVLRALELDA